MATIRNLTLVFAALITVAGMTACNTIEGAGKDVQAGGKVIEREADKANH